MGQPRFKFSLESLLELRRQAEKEQQRKVAVIQQEINVLVNKVKETEKLILDGNRLMSTERLVGKLDLGYISNEKRYIGTLHMLVMQTLQKLTVIERKLTAAKGLLLEAARARKVMEKLREKQFKRWMEEQNRKEAERLDEIGTQLAIRQREVLDEQENAA